VLEAAVSNRSKIVALFDHLIGDGEQLWWHSEAEHRGGLEVDDKLEFARLHNRQILRLLTLEDAAGIGAGQAREDEDDGDCGGCCFRR